MDARYPVHWPATYTREEAEKAKKAVEKIRKFIGNRLLIKKVKNRGRRDKQN